MTAIDGKAVYGEDLVVCDTSKKLLLLSIAIDYLKRDRFLLRSVNVTVCNSFVVTNHLFNGLSSSIASSALR